MARRTTRSVGWTAGLVVALAAAAAAQDSRAELRRGQELYQAGDFGAAEEAFTRAIGAEPTLSEAFHWRAYARMQQGDRVAGLQDAEQAVKLAPDDHGALRSRAMLRQMNGQLAGSREDYDRVVADLERAGELRTDLGVEVLVDRAEVRLKQGDLPGAVADADRVLGMIRGHPGALFARARARALAGDPQGAARDALASQPGWGSNYYPTLLAAIWSRDAAHLRPVRDAGGPWFASLAAFVMGQRGEQQLLEDARATPDAALRDEQLCEAYGYIGMLADMRGETEAAKRQYESCVATKVTHFVEYWHARVRLDQIAAAGRGAGRAAVCGACEAEIGPNADVCPACGARR